MLRPSPASGTPAASPIALSTASFNEIFAFAIAALWHSRPPCTSFAISTNSCGSLDLAVGPELLEVGPQVGDILFVPDSDDHSGPGNLRGRIWHEFLERRFAP